ncbi:MULTISPECIES: serine hydroxymethyltransferase [Limosilactobacillus]|jgi:glycine hydroxymethyltransferase|uniref:Serine hydroxymethyltransferase n=1 Tax=Limosilactobacillus vaginalis DSM 5837 = ATCC 49540 TaxID=1423814 RepID=C2EV12_9LACO|nr:MULTISPECIES: serine hydroxymethyltransferase [Limosilactobacillus]EEJ40231.1 glycine hydroxymethyltransferase [Limosilactobacillus vaginalis DSM 5837 = ATCC 49540]MCI6852234.1 serine hydroxymethyltransferase [Limosilactobacillus vaginalis]MCZ2466283.1 serine hydroxymethyltransferase [Limosilactobacillus vaginalis]MDM8259803.1 serine hydroxymethyltransferase [Limosilactobacillus vaginalis]MDY4864748.1 serine hydroxymethyltransferase [Limosilactobacillus sp.]
MDYAGKSPELWAAIKKEEHRQQETIELIASENIVSKEVREAQGSVLTNKYAEGYPGKRYYGGCQYIDQVEQLAIDYAKKLFGAEYANVQPHSGSQANMAVYQALLKPGDKILGMGMDAGGHLTHGAKVNFSGKVYESYSYGLNPATEELDFDQIEQLALEINPRLIVAGASAYSKIIDWQKFRKIADEVGAYLMVDMAHIAGLVATGAHPNPVPVADVVTTTTHKTLRGPRGGMILSKSPEIGKKINSALFPGTQGGPLEHVIAGKAQAFYEDLQPQFTDYINQVVKNAAAMADKFNKSATIRVVSGGTENHLLVIDITKTGITGKDAQDLLDEVHITTNKESIPNDQRSPFVTSGLRIGTPAVTSRGFKEADVRQVADLIIQLLEHADDKAVKEEVAQQVHELTSKYPIEE